MDEVMKGIEELKLKIKDKKCIDTLKTVVK